MSKMMPHYKIENSTSDISPCHEPVMKVCVHMSDKACLSDYVGL
jgi:hypothetical protein